MTPENLYQQMKRRIKKEWLICFASVFMFGILAHGYRFANNLPNWDALLNEYDSQNTIYLGRCFLSLACGISSYYELPWFNGLLSLFYLACTAVLVSEILKIRSRSMLICLGGFLAVFPAVTSTFAYIYTADGYFLSCLCMALAVFLIQRRKRGWIWGTLLICLGSGMYQAYITFAIVLILLEAIREQLFEKRKLDETFRFLGKSLLAGVLGTALYYGVLTVLLRVEHQTLDGYQDIQETYSFSNLNIPHALKQCAIEFVTFFTGDGSKVNLYVVLNVLMLFTLAVFVIRKVVCAGIFREPARLVTLGALHILLPVGCYALFLIAPYVDYHMLMRYGVCGIYIYFLMFYDQSIGRGDARKKWCILGLSALLLYQFVLLANVSYHILEMSYEKSYSMVVRMADRLEQAEGWETCESLAVLGRQEDTEAYSVYFPPDITGITYGTAARENFNVQAMLEDYAGIRKKEISEEEKEAILASEEYSAMSSWPDAGSIQMIDGIMVLKLGEADKN
jgi:hypothetical protein